MEESFSLDEAFVICKEKADWIGQEIGKDISRRLQLGEKQITLVVVNDDPGMDYVMIDIGSKHDRIMLDAQDEWRRREEMEWVEQDTKQNNTLTGEDSIE